MNKVHIFASTKDSEILALRRRLEEIEKDKQREFAQWRQEKLDISEAAYTVITEGKIKDEELKALQREVARTQRMGGGAAGGAAGRGPGHL